MPQQYDRVAVALHGAIGALLLAQLTFGFALDDIAPRGTPARGAVVNLHKSCGLVLLALATCRLAWRLRHAPPHRDNPLNIGRRGRRLRVGANEGNPLVGMQNGMQKGRRDDYARP